MPSSLIFHTGMITQRGSSANSDTRLVYVKMLILTADRRNSMIFLFLMFIAMVLGFLCRCWRPTSSLQTQSMSNQEMISFSSPLSMINLRKN